MTGTHRNTEHHSKSNTKRTEGPTMGTSITIDLSDATIDALGAAIAAHLKVDVAVQADTTPAETSAGVPAKKAAAKKATPAKATKKAEPEPEVEDEDEDTSGDREAELRGMKIPALRKIALGLGFDADEVKDADKDTLVEAILSDEGDEDDDESEDEDEADETEDEDDSDEDDEDEDSEDEDEDSEGEADEEAYSRDDLEAMSLRELKALAKEWEVDVPKGIDQDDLINLMLGESDEDEDAEDEDDEYTEADLKAMDIADLKALAKEWDVTLPKNAKKPGVIKALLAE